MMRLDPKKISEIIRKKKMALMNKEPELVDTDWKPDLNPNDVDALNMQGRIEETLNTPKKTDIMDDEMAEADEMGNVGLTKKDHTRMERLRAMFDDWDNSAT